MIKMKNVFFKKLVIGAVSGLMCLTMLPKAPNSTYAANIGDKLNVGNGTNQHKGNCDGYSYEVWIDSTGGSGSMTLGSGAAFTAEWSANVSSGNFLARRGLDFGSQKKATEYPYIGLDYEADYRQTGSANGNSRLCVYGWFQNKNAGNVPLVEYYIIEDWVDWCPDASGKMVTIDGAQYKIFQMDHTGPTINGGSETFKQYFSVRQDKRTSGHITVSDHFKAWADEGWGIGNLYEVALNAEGWQSSGIADIKKLDVYTDPDKKDPSIGEGDTPSTPSVEPDADGNYFKSTFSSNSTDKWKSRGDASIGIDTKNYYSADGSLFISGRTDNWHGASYSLDPNAFKAGNTYSFSAGVLQKSGETTPMQLTLQYTLDGEENYEQIALADIKSGEWTNLENTSFEIPAGAANASIYIEAPESLTDFYIDDVQGSVAGTKSKVVTGGGTVDGAAPVTPPTTTAPPDSKIVWGDANCDGKVEIADATLILQFLTNKDEYQLTDEGMINADVDGVPGVTANDALVIQQLDAGIIKSLPLGGTPSTPTATTTSSKTDSSSVDPASYMANVRASMTNDVPASATNGNSDYGTLKEITYYSSIAQKNKKANVLLPAGYSTNETYPVLYVNHGIFGDHNTMLDDSMKIRSLAGNLVESGEAEKMIIVFTSMYTSKTSDQCQGFTVEETQAYDAFREDIAECLMPYIEKNYSVKTGRENTALAGFSMGGRETLYIGVTRPDLFGYIGAACPAPGVTPGSDSFMTHPGNMSEADFKIKDTSNYPYLWLITGGTNDTVVGQFPQSYHKILTTNKQDHIWQEIQGGGHDASCVVPMMYNFMKGIFKVNSSSSTTNPSDNTKDVILNDSFDSSIGDWSSRGDASITLDTENYYSGKSLFVSGRTDNWNGAAIELDTAEFKAGNTYSFSAAVMQKSGETTPVQLTLQYSLDGEDNYDQIASADVKSGEWTKLENTSFKIPAGAENLLLYVEAPDSLTDFYIDEVQAGAEGTKSSVVTGKGTVSSTPASNPNTPVSGDVDISWIDPSKPMVAISFDDGAVGNSATDSSMRIINAIANEGFHATFFYVGDWIRNSAGEGEVKYAFSKGMEIANHTKSHPNLSQKSASEIRSEYDQCAAKLKGIIGTEPSKLLRLPYLASNATVTSTLSDVPMITCSIDTADWNGATKDDIINKVVTAKNNGSLNGAIVLCHETYNTTAEAMEYLAPYLKSEGWQIVTISEMFAVKQQQLDGGKIYTKTN